MLRARILTSCLLLALACGGGTTPNGEGTSTGDEESESQLLTRLNAAAREGAVTDTLHGTAIADPYRSLEEDTPATQAWVDQQSARTRRALDSHVRPGMAERVDQLLSIGTLGGAKVGGERVFYTKREGEREQPALYMVEGGAPRERPLVDAETMGERAAMDWYYPSPGGRYVAFGISHNGDERSTLHVLDVNSGELLAERIRRTKWSTVTWLHDETGFYYTRYPEADEEGFDAEDEDTYFPRVFFHGLGADASEDPLVYGGAEGTWFPSASVSADDRWVVINVFRGWSATDVFLLDRGESVEGRVVTPGEGHALTTLVTGEEHITVGIVHDDRVLLYTNKDAPRYRIASVPVATAATAPWTDVVAETEATMDGWEIVGGKLAITYIEDVRSKVRLFALDGGAAGEVELPARGSVGGTSGRHDGNLLAFTFSSYLHPPSLLGYDMTTGEVARLDEVESDLDLSDHVIEQVSVTSADGTEVPVYLMHRADMERDGQNPVLLYGYGGFNVSLLPSFTRNALYWLERGGVYAVATLRGGGEFGEAWHRAGNLENKERVFEDFEAVIQMLSDTRVSNPERIGITGGSNGGLLMGAMVTRVPTRFRAAATYVGLYDMVRYHQFPPAQLWVTEYGSAEDPAQLAYLHAYSPYHRVRADTAYPSVLVETADHDSRVFWGHSTKFAAALQEATSSERPVYFHMVREVGHGAGTRLSDVVDKYVRMYAFLEHELGVE